MVSLINRIATAFRYDAVDGPSGKRRAVPRRVVREDYHTRGNRRAGMQESAADLARNLSLAAWMVRRHLDYVSQFAFHCHTESDELNRDIEALMVEDSTPQRADIAGRFGREKMFRLAEARRVLDGDTLLVKLMDGRMQGIQADLMRDPEKRNPDAEWIQGVQVNRLGRPIRYHVHARQGLNEVTPGRDVAAENAIHYGFFERFAADQVRGVSPLVAALNPLRDVYENFDYALAKAKVAHIFALSIFRNPNTNADEEDACAGEEEEGAEGPADYDIDLSRPNVLNLDPGDRAEVLESRQPSTEFQEFTRLVIQVALKALDIPYSFYDEKHTNFFGSRAAWLHYERSCSDRRDDQIAMRQNYTDWKLSQWIRDRRLTLPRGMRVADVRYDWVPKGMPWWDPAKEVSGTISAIAAGLDTPQRACRATGTEFYENVREIAKAQEFAAKHGVRVAFNVDPVTGQSAIPIDGRDDEPDDEGNEE